MAELSFTVDKTIWLSANQRLHWADKARRVKMLREAGRVETLLRGVRDLGPTHVAAFIGYPRNGRADPSNAADTVKALIDGATDAGAWPDDDHTHVIGPTFLRGPASGIPGMYRVRLVLTPQDIPWLDGVA